MPSPQQACRTPANTRGRGDLGVQGRRSGRRLPSPREPGKTGGNKKLFKKREKQNRGRSNAAYFNVWSVILSGSRRGEQGARRPGDVIKHGVLMKHGRHLITDTGHWRHWAYKQKEIKRGELKQVGSNQNTGGD